MKATISVPSAARPWRELAKLSSTCVSFPMADPRIRRAVVEARALLEPAQKSPTSTDLQKLRQDFHRGPVNLAREVVAEEIADLARLSTQLADTSALISKALAGATGAALSRAE